MHAAAAAEDLVAARAYDGSERHASMITIPPLLLAMAAVTVVGALGLGLVLHQRELAVRGRHWLDRVLPSPELTRARPIEQLARDLVRVRADVLAIRPGTPMARRRGITQAYDELLAEACRELGLDDPLSGTPLDRRQGARTQVEQALARAGLRLG